MKINLTSFGKARSLFGFTFFLLIIVFLNSCKDEPQLWKVDSEDQVIGDYIADNPDQFSEFEKLVELAGMKSLLKIRGPFTVFIPSDEAMMEYYSYQGVGGLEDFDVDFLELLCKNHFINNYIGTGDIGLGALAYVNGNGDYLASEFDGSDIMISKSSKIVPTGLFTFWTKFWIRWSRTYSRSSPRMMPTEFSRKGLHLQA